MLRTQYPYIDDNHVVHTDLIRTYSDAENGFVKQIETGIIYGEAIDIYPCSMTYEEVIIEPEPEEDPEGESEPEE